LLELGAGAGRNTSRYKGFKRVVLLDYSFSQLQLAQSKLGQGDRYIYVAADVYRLPFVSGLFDFSTMIRTLHHIVDVPRALHQVRRVLGFEAGFILEYASKKHLKAVLRYILGRQSWNPFATGTVENVALNFNFHPKTIREWLEENNFEVERQLTVSHFRSNFIKHFVPLTLLVGMDSLAQFSGDLWQFTPSVFVKAAAVGSSPEPDGSAFFQCPACDFFPLEPSNEYCLCPGCSQRWEIRDGIYDFRLPTPEG
jgi:hypothetical protein